MRQEATVRGRTFAATIAIAAGTVFSVAPMVRAQELDRQIANVETETEMGPQDIPGQQKGDRSKVEEKPAAPVPAPAAAPRDWFGEKPWWEWSRATGDWAGMRTWLEEHGLTISASYTLDWTSVWSGGVRNVASTNRLTDINLAVDTDKLAGWKGGTFFVDFYSTDGHGGSADVGDLHGISNIATADNLDQVAEVWYEQWMFDKFLRIKVGKVDANREFALCPSGSAVHNSSAGISTPIFTMPTYPDPATSVNVFVYPTEWLYAGFGLYDGATVDGFHTGRRGPATFFSDSKSSSWFMIGEVGATWKDFASMGKGRVAAGAWTHTGDFTRFDSNVESGTTGFYATVEQQLWHPSGTDANPDNGLFAYVRYAWSDEDVTAAGQHIGGGLTLKGTFGDRTNDQVGVYASTLILSDATGASFDGDETLVEAF